MSAETKSARSSPAARRSQVLRLKLLESIAEPTVEKVTKKLGELAENGNLTAIKLLLEYAAGRPAQAREVSGRDPKPSGLSWGQVRSIILAALSMHPQAKIELATALETLAHDESVLTDREDT